MTTFYGLNDRLKWDTSADLTDMDLPVVVDNVYHTIRADGQYILIELKD